MRATRPSCILSCSTWGARATPRGTESPGECRRHALDDGYCIVQARLLPVARGRKLRARAAPDPQRLVLHAAPLSAVGDVITAPPQKVAGRWHAQRKHG